MDKIEYKPFYSETWPVVKRSVELKRVDGAELWDGASLTTGRIGKYYYMSGGWGVVYEDSFTLNGQNVNAEEVGRISGTGCILIYMDLAK